MSSKRNSKTIIIADFARPCNISISCFNVNEILTMMKRWYWASRRGGDWSWSDRKWDQAPKSMMFSIFCHGEVFSYRGESIWTLLLPLHFCFQEKNQETTIRLVPIILRLAHKVVIMKRDCKNMSVIEIPAIRLPIPVNLIILIYFLFCCQTPVRTCRPDSTSVG